MPQKNPVTARTIAPRLNATERRAAQVAGLVSQQSDLKREAAERRLARAGTDTAPTGRPRRKSTTR